MTHGRGGGGAPETIRLDVPGGAFVNVERGMNQRRAGNVLSASLRMERAPRTSDPRNESREFDPQFTLQRWAEEAKTLNGEFVSQRLDALSNHVILALLPAAMEAAKKAKILEEQEQAKQREAQAKAEEEAALQEKQKAEENAAKEAEEAAKREAEEASRTATEQEPRPLEIQDTPMQEASTDTTPAPDGDAEMADASNDASPPPPANIPEVATTSTGDNVAAMGEPGESSSGQAGSSNVPERVTVMIHGSPVDITDTGIDPTFLEALPDDMREEVLNQHVRDQRAAIIERPADSQISSEFLDALPPEIRAEIIQQERQEQARRDNATTGGPGSVGVAADIDPASFIASLDPHLRQAVLLDQDDGFIQSLPSHMLAEAQGFRDSIRSRRQPVSRGGAPPPRPAVPRKMPTPHDAIQLLDKTGIAVLVRLLFFPQVLRKTLLFRVLVNLCENGKTRTELFNLLLNILQDGTGDLAAVDKSFAQMSVRSSKTSSQQTPKAAGKQKAGSDYFSGLSLPNLQYEAIPELVAQRCLEGLTFIVSNNEQSSLFFLTEHELPAGLRRTASKKGKGKEKQVSQTHYPVVLLLGLLDRQSLLKTPSIMESVVGLLATVTRPLSSIKNSNQEVPSALQPAAPSQASSSTPTSLPAPSAPSTTVSPPTTAAPPTSSTPIASLDSTTIPAASATSSQQEPLPSGMRVLVYPMQADVTLDQQPGIAPPQVAQAPIAPSQSVPEEEKCLLANPPQIPHTSLRYIVNILTTGECSGRTFQQSLALIQHLSYIPDARDVIAFELKSKAQEFGQTLLSDLDQLATALQGSSDNLLVGSVAIRFSPASSEQAKLLRVLKTIDYMYSTKLVPTSDSARNESDSEKVQSIYESFRFAPLWQRLGDCLAIVEEKPDTEHIATVLLPLIEALMVVCKYVGSQSPSASATRALRASASPMSPSTPRETMEDLFVTFTDAHRKVLNLMVRNNPSLMSGSFSLLVHNPRVLDFDNKRNYFNQQLHRRPHVREHHGTLQLNVRRARVFEDSFQHLQRKTGDQIKYGKLSVRFYDEEGVDAGGVTREWFQILARQMFDPNNALFQPCAADRLTYQPNKNSWVNPEHLSFFKFVGRVIGKAIYDGRLLDAYFARSLYRQLLGKPVDYRDVEWVDPEYYNSLCWILENDPTMLELTFSVEADEVSVFHTYETFFPHSSSLSVWSQPHRTIKGGRRFFASNFGEQTGVCPAVSSIPTILFNQGSDRESPGRVL
jgi:E3 ubiquitin-protein ligase HUWE1